MTFRLARLCLAAVTVAALSTGYAQTSPRPARAAQEPSKGGDEMVPAPFKLADTDVDGMLGALETLTGRTVLRTQALPTNSYTINITRPIPKSELILALETLLELNNVGVTPMGDRFLKVVPLSSVKSEAPPLIPGSTLDLPPSGRVATKLFQLQFLRVTEFFQQGLGALFSQGIGGFGAGVVVLEKANAAIVTDTITNLQRIETLVASLDRPVSNGMNPVFYPLHNSKASDLVTKIKGMLTGPIASQIGSATTFTADDRTNQIVLLADERQRPFFDELVAKLDVPSDPNTRNEVVRLKNADANTLATTLTALVTGQNTATQRAAGNQAQSVRPGEIGYSPQGAASGTSSVLGGPAPAAPEGGGAAPAPAGAAARPTLASLMGNAAAASAQFSSLVTIQADERTNSVVISGTIDDLKMLKDLIEKLDVALTQVRIEVIIAEVRLDDTDKSGLTALNLTFGTDGIRGTHVTNFGGSVTGWDVTSGVVNPLAFAAAMNQATNGSKNLVRVLQAPVIVTSHNKPAEVQVGEQIPVETGGTTTPISSGTSGVSNSTTFTTTYKPVQVDLKVTPLIGDDGSVQMTVDQVVDDQEGSVSINGNDTPILGHREATSFVTVQDGQMIVLGGLQKTQKTTNHSKIGLIYEIPILSQLLGGHSDELERDELLVFIRPHVIRPGESTADTEKKIQELSNKEQVNKYLTDPTDQKADSKAKNLLDRFKEE